MLAHARSSRIVDASQRAQALAVELSGLAAGGDLLIFAGFKKGLVLLPAFWLRRIASSRNPPREAKVAIGTHYLPKQICCFLLGQRPTSSWRRDLIVRLAQLLERLLGSFTPVCVVTIRMVKHCLVPVRLLQLLSSRVRCHAQHRIGIPRRSAGVPHLVRAQPRREAES